MKKIKLIKPKLMMLMTVLMMFQSCNINVNGVETSSGSVPTIQGRPDVAGDDSDVNAGDDEDNTDSGNTAGNDPRPKALNYSSDAAQATGVVVLGCPNYTKLGNSVVGTFPCTNDDEAQAILNVINGWLQNNINLSYFDMWCPPNHHPANVESLYCKSNIPGNQEFQYELLCLPD
jgi:hypothetical protein